MRRSYLIVPVFFALVAALTACGGGGGGGTTAAPSVPTATPAAATPSPAPATATPAPLSTTVAVSASNTTVALQSTNGIVVNVTIPGTSTGSGTVALSVASAAPPSSIERRPQDCTTKSWMVVAQFTPSADNVFPSYPLFSYTNVSIQSGFSAWLSVYSQQKALADPLAGPGTINGSSVSFTPPLSPFSVKAGVAYQFWLYQQQSGCASPVPTITPTVTPTPSASPVPSATPTPVPTPPAVSVSPATLNFIALSQTEVTNVSEVGYSGTFTASTGCSGIANVTAQGGGGFSVTSVAAGSCQVTFTDANGKTGTLQVFVTTTSITGT